MCDAMSGEQEADAQHMHSVLVCAFCRLVDLRLWGQTRAQLDVHSGGSTTRALLHHSSAKTHVPMHTSSASGSTDHSTCSSTGVNVYAVQRYKGYGPAPCQHALHERGEGRGCDAPNDRHILLHTPPLQVQQQLCVAGCVVSGDEDFRV